MISDEIREEAREFLQRHPYTTRMLERGDEFCRRTIHNIKVAAGVEE
ncbi:MAG: hypothetical protein Q8J68_09390 [Methanolobus sp.]|nr:hypothetical protein [Methanolobus sp.]MDP2217486.1 hypothetical protein [Methanolobus sp.]